MKDRETTATRQPAAADFYQGGESTVRLGEMPELPAGPAPPAPAALAPFTAALLLSALLLFLVEPMFAKMVLPLLGGSPAVWNPCMMFFQAALLGGYVYAHLTLKHLGVRRQAVLHLGLLLLPLLLLPIRIPAG